MASTTFREVVRDALQVSELRLYRLRACQKTGNLRLEPLASHSAMSSTSAEQSAPTFPS